MNDKKTKFSQTLIFRAAMSLIYTAQALRVFLHLYLFFTSTNRTLIEKDIARWIEVAHPKRIADQRPPWRELVWLLWRHEEYRNLFYYRIKREFRISSRIGLEIAKLILKPSGTLFLKPIELGEGLFIQHGYATSVGAKSIGKNCWINQMVVIGYSDKGKAPTLGDNVHISAGAKVFGDITIGDNVIVGANAVVTKNVPPNCTVVGVPAYIIKRDGQKVKEPL
ncbi:MAG: hypothetical protein IT310_14685 [Anaerolineales bacterium]|nr:hypothetical protein [Anaerolineales bacterium]